MMTAAIQFYIAQPDYFSFVEQYTYAPFLFGTKSRREFSIIKTYVSNFHERQRNWVIKTFKMPF